MFYFKSFRYLLVFVFSLVFSGAYAYGPILGPGGDANAQAFNTYYNSNIQPTLPTMDGQEYNPIPSLPIPTILSLGTTSNVRVYFLDSFAAFDNRLGLYTNTTGPAAPANDVFASLNFVSSLQYVNIGILSAGTVLNFYLQPDGDPANGLFWNNSLLNLGLLNVVRGQLFGNNVNGALYYVLGWDDSGGSLDADFNDFLMAVEIIPASMLVPEPETYLLLGSMLIFTAAILYYRKKRSVGFVHIKN